MANALLFFLTVLFGSWGCNGPAPENSITRASSEKVAVPASHRMEAYLPMLTDKRIGLVVNHTSTIGPVHLVDTLISLGVNIGVVFTPEHGFKGSADAGELVADDMYLDVIPIKSLYGSKKKPSVDDLAGLDLLVFDIQDVGVRFYTYISTLHYIMEAAAEARIPVMVLDRPNPNGHYVDGPVMQDEFKSFVGMHPVPVVYGMTIGEYATMIAGEGWLDSPFPVALEVIECGDYSHNTRYILPIPTSPNLPNERAVLLYPSLCFFEGTTMSVGRGTDRQFQLFGHPSYEKNGFSFVPQSSYGSKNPKHRDLVCEGIDLTQLRPEDIRTWKKIRLNFLQEAYKTLDDKGIPFFRENNFFEKLAGNSDLRKQILNGTDEETIRNSWKEDLETFLRIRKNYLLYPDFTT